ncbi:hypothetical protein BDQ12DRAFT_666688 [Crucibulum laeve]|uniref:Uncharacterized protein n=1 Tax=Crucibulum laeve TaxID=68775 RepID=A0A5C3LXW5_9AGAR|nr:hypothetical protein BDQ12DRAFT_666688 [Crucibulum laeve]
MAALLGLLPAWVPRFLPGSHETPHPPPVRSRRTHAVHTGRERRGSTHEHFPPRARVPHLVSLTPGVERRRVLPVLKFALTLYSPSLFLYLTYLSLHGIRNPVGLLKLGSLLSFPAVQEPKVGGLSAAGSFCIEVAGVLTSGPFSSSVMSSVIFKENYEDSPEEESQLLPTTMKQIILQAAPAPIVRVGKQVMAQIKDQVMLEKLRVLEGTGNGVEVVVLPREEM